MKTSNLDFFNDFFENLTDVELIKEIVFKDKAKRYEGAIKYKELSFQVIIPEAFPIGNLKFIAQDFVGLPHQNYDGSICLNTRFVNHAYTMLDLEVSKLKSYISEYYEQEKEEEFYEYAAADTKDLVTLVFEEESIDYSRFKVPFGQFNYSVFGCIRSQDQKINKLTVIAQGIGNKDYKWSKAYKEKEKYIGAWVFIDKEPVHARKHRFTNWAGLAEYLPLGFAEYFNKFQRDFANYKLYPRGPEQFILLALGYEIPSEKGNEVNWDLVLMPRFDFKRKSIKSLDRYTKNIIWDKSFNSSFERFFGRGSLDRKLATKKTLIIGNGAIGSSLAEILIRSGLRELDLADIDTVEPGNICRSTFSFTDVSHHKSSILKYKLEEISPFVEVGLLFDLKATSVAASDYLETYKMLDRYDLIIDCTANNEIIQMLTDMNLSKTVCYISMSNKAKEMIFVTNDDNSNLIERRNQMLYSFGTYSEPEFREGTGCWHPTFEASFFDMNQLLNFVMRKMNGFYKNCEPLRSFYSFIEEDSIRVSEDIKFIQLELNLRITIESLVLDKISDLSKHHFPNEFGGVLMGSYLDDYTELVISDVITPENYENGVSKFKPNHEELNKKLKDYYGIYNDKVIYVGDWHSHPNGTNRYSQTDFDSIKRVANSTSVNINNPVLLIVAIGNDEFEPGFYVYDKNELLKFTRL